jgi:hypothetical protein
MTRNSLDMRLENRNNEFVDRSSPLAMLGIRHPVIA